MITPFSIFNRNSKTFANRSQAIGQFINSLDITHYTGCHLVLLSPTKLVVLPLPTSVYHSRPASGYWSLVVTVIYSGPLSGHKTLPADDNSPDRLTATIVLCSIVGTFAPFAAISLFMCPAGRSRVDRVFSLFLPLNTRRFIFFFSDCALSFWLKFLWPGTWHKETSWRGAF